MEVVFDTSTSGGLNGLAESLFAERIKLEVGPYSCVTSGRATLRLFRLADREDLIGVECVAADGDPVPGTKREAPLTVKRRAFDVYPFDQSDPAVLAALHTIVDLLAGVCV